MGAPLWFEKGRLPGLRAHPVGAQASAFSGMGPFRQARRSNLQALIDEGPNGRADALEQRGVNALMDVVLLRFLTTEERCDLVR